MKFLKSGMGWVKRKGQAVVMVVISLMLAGAAIRDLPTIGRFYGGKFPDLGGIAYATFTAPTIDTENVLTIAGAVFTAIAAIWFVKKGIKLLNRS